MTTSGDMSDIVFGATLRLHTTIVHLLLQDFNLEECRGEGAGLLGGRRQGKSHQSHQSSEDSQQPSRLRWQI